MLEAEQNVIIFSFSLKITGGLKYPAACNNEIFRQRYQAVITDYLEREHCREPARRYAHNIACGRFLWRNLVGAEHIEVVVDNLSAEKNSSGYLMHANTAFVILSRRIIQPATWGDILPQH